MKIVIDIPNWLYNAMMEWREPHYSKSLGDAVRDGTPLPEHHGRLIDADALIDTLSASDRDIYCKAVIEEDAPTIIEGSESE